MEFTKLKFYIPVNTTNITNNKFSNTKFIGGKKNHKNKFIPTKQSDQNLLYDVEPDDEIYLNKQYTEITFWDDLLALYHDNPNGFHHHNLLPPTLTFNSIPGSIKYTDDETQFSKFIYLVRKTMHIGQRKLFISELQFLSNHLQPNEDATIVYAGAAPSCKIWILMQLFPRVKFVLIDPNEFWIYWGEYDKPH
jgi:hypothetical protein